MAGKKVASDTTESQKAEATPSADESSTPEHKVTRIKYTGPAVHTRMITAEDFERVGVHQMETQTWSPENGHLVVVDDKWTKKAVDLVLGLQFFVDPDAEDA